MIDFLSSTSWKKCICLNAVYVLSSRERPAPSYLLFLPTTLVLFPANSNNCWQTEVLTAGPAVMNKLNRPETAAEQKLLCCLLLFLVAFCAELVMMTLVKPSAGLQPDKSLRGGHVMCHFNQKCHISFVSIAMCAFCLCSDVNLVFICCWPTVNASEQKTDIQQSSFIWLCILETATCQSQIYRWIHLKQWNDPR